MANDSNNSIHYHYSILNENQGIRRWHAQVNGLKHCTGYFSYIKAALFQAKTGITWYARLQCQAGISTQPEGSSETVTVRLTDDMVTGAGIHADRQLHLKAEHYRSIVGIDLIHDICYGIVRLFDFSQWQSGSQMRTRTVMPALPAHSARFIIPVLCN